MNVLVVDDQERVLKATKLLVHWDQIGVDRVFTASSAKMARQVFARENVDVLLTDIEMPGEDGLALHRWQMEHSPDTACIFLTSHADFSYAQEAIRNGAYGYILQPAEIPEIENIVSGCVKHLQEQRAMRKKSEEFDQKKALIFEEYVFAMFYQREQFSQMDAFCRSLGPAGAQTAFLPVLAECSRGDSAAIRAALEPALAWLAEELSGSASRAGTPQEEIPTAGVSPQEAHSAAAGNHSVSSRCIYSPLDENRAGILLLLPRTDDTGRSICLNAEREQQGLQRVLDQAAARAGYVLNLCAGKLSTADLPAAIAAVCSFAEGRILARGRAFLVDRLPETELRRPDSNAWSQWMIRGDGALIRNQIGNLLRAAKENTGLTEEYLRELTHLFLEACSAACYEKKLEVKDLFSEDFTYEEMLHACHSPERFMAGVDQALRQYAALSGDENREATAGERIRDVIHYIDLHLDQPLTRRDAAKLAYMNEDYFSRVFRRETGTGFKEFITARKLDYARRLLEETDMPVVMISSKVGYEDFNNFSKAFRKVVGQSPTEYRKTHRG